MNESLISYAKKYGIFAVLFVALLIFMLNGYEKREGRLMDYLNEQAKINLSISSTLEKIDVRLQKLECK